MTIRAVVTGYGLECPCHPCEDNISCATYPANVDVAAQVDQQLATLRAGETPRVKVALVVLALERERERENSKR